MILTISKNRLERFPVNPARLPAVLKSWHGKPPTTMSASPRCAWKVRTSSKRATCGQCSASTARHCGSLSTCATTVWPACSKAMSNPPMPANREMILTLSPQLHGGANAVTGCQLSVHSHRYCIDNAGGRFATVQPKMLTRRCVRPLDRCHVACRRHSLNPPPLPVLACARRLRKSRARFSPDRLRSCQTDSCDRS